MNYEVSSPPGLRYEPVFQSEEGSPINFKLQRAPFPRPYPIYTVDLSAPLDPEHIERVVAFAGDATTAMGLINDLSTLPNLDDIPIDPTLFKFTHALEHLTAIHLARISLSALFQLKLQGIPGGRTTIYQESLNGNKKFHIGFSLTPGFSPSVSHEQRSIKSACVEVSGIK